MFSLFLSGSQRAASATDPSRGGGGGMEAAHGTDRGKRLNRPARREGQQDIVRRGPAAEQNQYIDSYGVFPHRQRLGVRLEAGRLGLGLEMEIEV